jgi:hypothetical protein
MKMWLMECSSIKTDPTRRALSVRLCIILFGRGPEAPSSEGGRNRPPDPAPSRPRPGGDGQSMCRAYVRAGAGVWGTHRVAARGVVQSAS